MIKSIHRAFDIIEYLARDTSRYHPLGEIAAAVELHPATCANMLKTLAARSYVEQEGPKKGYMIGPMAYYIAGRGAYRPDMVRIAEPLITALASEIQENVVLSLLHGDKLFMLCQASGDSILQLRRDVVLVDDVYKAVNGRLLLAYLSPDELDAFITQHGLPKDAWPEAATREQLQAILSHIRTAGCHEDVLERGVARAAFPVWEHGRVTAALGVFAPEFRFTGTHRASVLQKLAETAHELSERLAHPPDKTQDA